MPSSLFYRSFLRCAHGNPFLTEDFSSVFDSPLWGSNFTASHTSHSSQNHRHHVNFSHTFFTTNKKSYPGYQRCHFTETKSAGQLIRCVLFIGWNKRLNFQFSDERAANLLCSCCVNLFLVHVQGAREASTMLDNQWDARVVHAALREARPSLHAAPQTRTTCSSLGSLILYLLNPTSQPPPRPHAHAPHNPFFLGKKGEDLQTHVVNHKTSHALCVPRHHNLLKNHASIIPLHNGWPAAFLHTKWNLVQGVQWSSLTLQREILNQL